MRRFLLIVLLVLLAMCFCAASSRAVQAATTTAPYLRGRADTRAPGAGGNEMCPVKPDQLASDEFQLQFQGKHVNFCCAECLEKFRHHPRPHWVRLPQYSPFLALNWPDPNLDTDRNHDRVNGYYRAGAVVGELGVVGVSILLIPLGVIAGRRRLRRANKSRAVTA